MRQSEESERGPVVETEPAPEHEIAKDDPSMPSLKSTKSPAFQFYPRDFLSDTNVDLMSMTERGIYITLISKCWLDQGLPSDMPSLARLVRMKTPQLERIWKNGTLASCFHERDGKLQHKRLDRERKVQAEFRKKQKANADKRWESRGTPTAMPAVDARHPSGNALQSASAICDPQSAGVGSRPQPLVARRRLDAAFEGPRVYVPQRVHTDFLGFRNGNADELHKWYEAVSEEWATGSRRNAETGPDMIAFWKARYAERWPAAPSHQPQSQRRPAWAPKAVQS